MTLSIVGEMRRGSATLRSEGEGGLSYGFSATLLVLSTEKTTSREEVFAFTPGLPIVGIGYGPFNAVCTSLKAERQESNPHYWHIECEFETRERQKQDPDNPSPDPTTWLPIFRVDSFITKEQVITVDKTPAAAGNVNFGTTGPYAITNSAKQPFETPLTQTFTLAQFSFTQFEDPTQTLSTLMERNDCVNLLSFAGFSPRTLLLLVTGAELGTYGGFAAWRITYQATFDPGTHDVFMLDVGTCFLDGGVPKPYMDATNSYRIVGNLNNLGAKVTDASTLRFRVKTEIDFATFIRQ
jgi:hypothetical protein